MMRKSANRDGSLRSLTNDGRLSFIVTEV